jgi:hypothetical protein
MNELHTIFVINSLHAKFVMFELPNLLGKSWSPNIQLGIGRKYIFLGVV